MRILKQSFKNHLQSISANLPEEVLGSKGFERLTDLCEHFPFDTAMDFGFETRLGQPEPCCDFFMQVKRGSAGHTILAGQSNLACLSPGLMKYPAWQRLTTFFSAWGDPCSDFAGSISQIWLEFDNETDLFDPVPSIFIQWMPHDGDGKGESTRSFTERLDEISMLLTGCRFPDSTLTTIGRCLLNLPPDAIIALSGFMLPRKTEAVRLIVSKIPLRQIDAYLSSIDWPGDTGYIRTLTDRYAGLIDHAAYNIHIDKQLKPYLGIEMYLKQNTYTRYDPRWEAVFDALNEDSLVLDPKRRGLRKFPGVTSFSHFYPVRYHYLINHLKLVYKEGFPNECKGYFGIKITPC